MSKQLELSQDEQERIPEYLTAISAILISKLDLGVDQPTLEGTISVSGEGKEIVFQITARYK